MPFHIEPAGLALGGTVSGNLIITGTLNVQGNVTFDVLQTTTGLFSAEGGILIDETGTEVLLVRKEADAGDVFAVNTTSGFVTITSSADTQGLTITGSVNNTTLKISTTGTGGLGWRIMSTANASGFGGGLLAIDHGDNDPRFTIATAETQHTQKVIHDVTDPEALLVRVTADGGDLFTVNTTDLNVAIGAAPVDDIQFGVLGNYTSGGVGSQAAKFVIDGALTGFAADTTYLAQAAFVGSITTQATAEAITDAATLLLQEPVITIGTATVVNAATLTILDAPSEGTSTNNAIYVKSGSTTIQALTTQGAVVMDTTLGVTGIATFDGQIIQDITSTEAFLIRIDSDGGDLFTADTSAMKILVRKDASSIATETDAGTGLVVAATSTNDLVRLSLQGGTNGSARIAFGDSGDEDIGELQYSNVTNTFSWRANASNNLLTLSDSNLVTPLSTMAVRFGAVGSDGEDETLLERLSVIGNIEVFDGGTLGAETLTDGDMSATTNWAGAVDWSDTIGGTTTYTHSGGTGTLTQTAAQRVSENEGSNARWYKFTYTVSAVTDVGVNTCVITNAFAAANVTLDISSAGTRSVVFQSHATTADTADFVLSATSDTASDTFTLDDLILKEIIGGDIILGGKLTGGGSNGLQVSGGGTVSTFEKDLGTVGATETVDWRDGNHQKVTLDENLTLTFIDPDGPASLVLHFVQDGSGTNTVAWPSDVDWEAGAAPVITAASASIDIVTLYFDGTRYFGGFLQNFS